MFLLLFSDGQPSADFNDLVDKYERRIFNLIYRIVGDYDEAADLTQDTFVAAFRSFATFRSESCPHTWLYRIAANVCKNWFRKKSRHKDMDAVSLDADEQVISSMSMLHGNAVVPEKALEGDELRSKLELAIAALPDDYRTVALLRDMEGLSYKEIAGVLGVSIDVVKMRLSRARAILRKKLEPYLSG